MAVIEESFKKIKSEELKLKTKEEVELIKEKIIIKKENIKGWK